jgi:hypothetical protein
LVAEVAEGFRRTGEVHQSERVEQALIDLLCLGRKAKLEHRLLLAADQVAKLGRDLGVINAMLRDMPISERPRYLRSIRAGIDVLIAAEASLGGDAGGRQRRRRRSARRGRTAGHAEGQDFINNSASKLTEA